MASRAIAVKRCDWPGKRDEYFEFELTRMYDTSPTTRTNASFPESVVVRPEIGSVAVMAARPGWIAFTRLRLPGVFVASATKPLLEAYVTRCVRFRVKPPVNQPVTVKPSCPPTLRTTECGAMTSFSSGHVTVIAASPPPLESTPVAGSVARIVAVPGPTALKNAPPVELGRATASSPEDHTTVALRSSSCPSGKWAVAVNVTREPAIAVCASGATSSVNGGSDGGGGGSSSTGTHTSRGPRTRKVSVP